jgi:hypothetical protein
MHGSKMCLYSITSSARICRALRSHRKWRGASRSVNSFVLLQLMLLRKHGRSAN